MKLTTMLIMILYGDNISSVPSEIFNVDVWRLSKAYAQKFVELINANGSDAILLSLSEKWLLGNHHVPFADKNNLELKAVLNYFF